MKSLAGIGAVISLGLLSCQSPPAKSPDPQRTAQSTKASAPKASAASESAGLPMPVGETVSFERELQEVSAFRRLDHQGELVGLSVEGSELISHVERAVDLETPPQALKGSEEMLVALGVAPLDFDYRATMLLLLRDQLAGLYEPRLKAMLIRADLKGVERRMTLLHELVHALQDQHFDLDEVVQWSPDDTDRSSALSCLAEGDATSAMFDGVLPNGQTALSLPPGMIAERMRDQAKETDKMGIPRVIHQSLRAPYLDGIGFVNALRRRGGWQEVNRVWLSPPTSTEQILHLEKYDAQEPALAVDVPSPPPDDRQWSLLLHDIWGEQSLRLIFEQWQDRLGAEVSAAGWGGDRIVVYESGNVTALAWVLVADSEADAEEMRQSFARALKLPGSKNAAGKRMPSEASVMCGPLAEGESAPRLAAARFGKTIVVTTAPLNRKERSSGSCAEARAWLEDLKNNSLRRF